ncbi:MAG: hypothetical protein R2764_10930 [Bacteroidales bacterium]
MLIGTSVEIGVGLLPDSIVYYIPGNIKPECSSSICLVSDSTIIGNITINI